MPAWTHSWSSAFWANLLQTKGHRAGDPLSWSHFIFGQQHLRRAHAQAALRDANAARMAQSTDQKGWNDYQTELRTDAGYTR